MTSKNLASTPFTGPNRLAELSVHHISGQGKDTVAQHVASLGTNMVQDWGQVWPVHRAAFAVACPISLEQIRMRCFCFSCLSMWMNVQLERFWH